MNYFNSSDIDRRIKAIVNHEVYSNLKTIEDVRIFMEAHVWAVWDFMSLLKFLQQRFTCVKTPWVPSGRDDIRQLINDIVLHEESDPFFEGQSHFQVYLKAMHEAGANADNINDYITCIRLESLEDYELYSKLPGYKHSQTVESLIDHGDVAEVAAVFAVGRENLIPEMFKPLLESLSQKHPKELHTLMYYLDRHIQLDGDEHAGMSDKLLDNAITSNESYEHAKDAAYHALISREYLLDEINKEIINARKNL